MKLAEEPFYSVQGEGPNIGMPAIFVRLWGCNLDCTWCDTKFAKDKSNCIVVSIKKIAEKIRKFKCKNVVFTGGEPLLQQKELIMLMEELLGLFWFFEIETNGTITPNDRLLELVDSWVVSPKLSNSGQKPYKVDKWFFECKSYHRAHKYLKFVVDKQKDLSEILEYILGDENFGSIEKENIFLMPQATSAIEHNEKLPFIIDFAKKFKFRVSPRLQILAYGSRRGV